MQRVIVAPDHTYTRLDSPGRGVGPSQTPPHDNPNHSQETDSHVPTRIRTRNPSKRPAADTHALDREVTGIEVILCFKKHITEMPSTFPQELLTSCPRLSIFRRTISSGITETSSFSLCFRTSTVFSLLLCNLFLRYPEESNHTSTYQVDMQVIQLHCSTK
jgi:hypothetical protein